MIDQQSLQLDTTTGASFDAGTKRITDIVDPTGAQDAATKQFVEDSISGAGEVPSPTAGQIGYHLEATAADTFGWVITTELPTPTSAQVTNNSVMSATSAAVGGVTLTTAPAAGGRAVNLLLNGGFRVAQNGTSFTAATVPLNSDATILLDRWRFLSEDATD